MKIGVGRYANMVRSLLHATDPAPGELEDIFHAGFTLENDRPEWSYLLGEGRFMKRVQRAADAANLSYVGIFNGQSTGVLGMLERAFFVNNTATAQLINVIVGGTTGLGSTQRGQVLDLRWRTKQSALLVGSGVEAALTGTLCGVLLVPAFEMAVVELRNVILPPNEQGMSPLPNLTFEPSVVNLAVDVTFEWRERALDRYEGAERR